MPAVAYRFGAFALDCDTRQLTRGGEEIHLSPKAFEMLSLLLSNRARAVSKAELQEHLWPAVFVEETNLAGLIAEIRRALSDSATQPSFVRTVHGFGYRFIGIVVEVAPAAPSAATAHRHWLLYSNRHVPLMEGANIIGRAPDATIQCEVAGVSRHHARIVVAGGEATLEDLGSKNGTFLQRKRITSARLSDGDEIRLGKMRFIFRLDPALDATDTVAPESTDVR
jgi:DNA-binding winged helix-turn-helix (wHTH) protein